MVGIYVLVFSGPATSPPRRRSQKLRNASEAPVTLPRGFCFLGTNVELRVFILVGLGELFSPTRTLTSARRCLPREEIVGSKLLSRECRGMRGRSRAPQGSRPTVRLAEPVGRPGIASILNHAAACRGVCRSQFDGETHVEARPEGSHGHS